MSDVSLDKDTQERLVARVNSLGIPRKPKFNKSVIQEALEFDVKSLGTTEADVISSYMIALSSYMFTLRSQENIIKAKLDLFKGKFDRAVTRKTIDSKISSESTVKLNVAQSQRVSIDADTELMKLEKEIEELSAELMLVSGLDSSVAEMINAFKYEIRRRFEFKFNVNSQ